MIQTQNKFYLFFLNLERIPFHHIILEVILIIILITLYKYGHFLNYKKPFNKELSEKNKQKIIKEWTPSPLVLVEEHIYFPNLIKTLSVKDKYIQIEIDDKIINCLNLSCNNFYGFIGNTDIIQECNTLIKTCGVGTCGPRGFYGSTNLHIQLEEKISKFLSLEETILYSYGLSTITSAIPAYVKFRDIVFCDEKCHMGIQTGIKASRCKVVRFSHNDYQDLEIKIQQTLEHETKNPKKFKNMRLFIIVESIYMNDASIINLKKLIEIKFKYKIRLFVDESLSFGILGSTGRGISEHFNCDIRNIDMICVNLEVAVGTMGGFCSGSKYVICPQRLTGVGYCYSASQPTFFVKSGIIILDRLGNKEKVAKLQNNCRYMFETLKSNLPLDYIVEGSEKAPICHIRPVLSQEISNKYEYWKLQNLMKKLQSELLKEKIAVNIQYNSYELEYKPIVPSIMISNNIKLTKDDMDNFIMKLSKTLQIIH